MLKVLLSGQSNGLGSNDGGPRTDTVSPLVQVWNNSNPLGQNGTAFIAPVKGADPFNIINAATNGENDCLGLWFCQRAAEELNDDIRLVIVAQGATAIEAWVTSDDASAPMYDEIAAVATASGMKPFDVFLWHQGEGNLGTADATYDAYFAELVTALRTDGILSASGIVIMGGVADGTTQRDDFNAARRAYAESEALVGFASASGLETSDGTHFIGQHLHELGYERYWAQYAEVAGLTTDNLYALVNEGGTPGTATSGTLKSYNIRSIITRLLDTVSNVWSLRRSRSAQIAAIEHAKLSKIIRVLGLTAGLKFCLDAGDSASYASGQTWTDTTANGYSFFLGATSGSEASDPTFNGTSGDRTNLEYFSCDGGDWFTYDSANEVAFNNMHKAGAHFTWFGWVWLATAADGSFFGTSGSTLTTQIGVRFTRFGASGGLFFAVTNGLGGAVTFQASEIPPNVIPGWNFIAITIREGDAGNSSFMWMNDKVVMAFNCAYASPSASAATRTLQLMARGNGNLPAPVGDRIAMSAMWEGSGNELTLQEISSLYEATRLRFGHGL